MPRHSRKNRHAVAQVAVVVLLVATLAARAIVATTFMSVDPIPGGDVVGEPTLARPSRCACRAMADVVM